MKLEHLTFETVWVKGVDNVETDALSRNSAAIQELLSFLGISTKQLVLTEWFLYLNVWYSDPHCGQYLDPHCSVLL